jgi:pantothenate kinase
MSVTFAHLVDRAHSLAAGERRGILGITGPPAAGKTTLAEELVRALAGEPVVQVPMDGFHLADAELDRLGRRDRKGAPDTFDAEGYAALLRRFREGTDEVVYAPGFERELEQPIAGRIPVHRDTRLVVSEGNYLLLDEPPWRSVRPLFDEIWYIDLDQPERLRRLVTRHIRFGKDEAAAVAWATGTDERNAALVAATRSRADLVLTSEVLAQVDRPPA